MISIQNMKWVKFPNRNLSSTEIKRAANLNNNLEVPDLWKNIENDIRQDPGIIVKNTPVKNPRARFIWLAAAAIVFIIIGYSLNFVFINNEDGQRILSQNALNDVLKTEQEYIKAINKLENVAGDEIKQIDPQLSELYRVKLETIVAQNPANRHMRKYLLAALQDKKQTLQEIIKYQG